MLSNHCKFLLRFLHPRVESVVNAHAGEQDSKQLPKNDKHDGQFKSLKKISSQGFILKKISSSSRPRPHVAFVTPASIFKRQTFTVNVLRDSKK